MHAKRSRAELLSAILTRPQNYAIRHPGNSSMTVSEMCESVNRDLRFCTFRYIIGRMKTKSFATTSPSDFRALKQKLNTAFRNIRARNVLTRQSFMCCMSCALHALPEDPSAAGIVYYHRQDADNLREYGELMVRFTPFERPGAPSGEAVGRIAV